MNILIIIFIILLIISIPLIVYFTRSNTSSNTSSNTHNPTNTPINTPAPTNTPNPINKYLGKWMISTDNFQQITITDNSSYIPNTILGTFHDGKSFIFTSKAKSFSWVILSETRTSDESVF